MITLKLVNVEDYAVESDSAELLAQIAQLLENPNAVVHVEASGGRSVMIPVRNIAAVEHKVELRVVT